MLSRTYNSQIPFTFPIPTFSHQTSSLTYSYHNPFKTAINMSSNQITTNTSSNQATTSGVPSPLQQGNTLQQRPTTRVSRYLKNPTSVIRNGFRRLRYKIEHLAGVDCSYRACRRGGRARDEFGQILPDVPPPPYVMFDTPSPRQTTARDHTVPVPPAAQATTSRAVPSPATSPSSRITDPMAAAIETSETQLRAIQQEIAEEQSTLNILRRRRTALEHSITISRLRWYEELANSMTAAQRRLHDEDTIYSTRLPPQRQITPAPIPGRYIASSQVRPMVPCFVFFSSSKDFDLD